MSREAVHSVSGQVKELEGTADVQGVQPGAVQQLLTSLMLNRMFPLRTCVCVLDPCLLALPDCGWPCAFFSF